MLSTLFSIITSRLLWGAIGITALAFVIWVIGPLVAIGDYRPLEPELNRQVIIGILYLFWLLYRIIPRIYSIWFNSRLLSNLRAANEIPQGEVKALPQRDPQLAQRFDEAIQLLKKARFNPGQADKHPWLNRFNRQYLYQLPWYVIIGAPGAGKTTALINSGLHFPLADSFGKSALRGVGGTRNCDWWFTNEAILLDTAGRYTTQESQRAEDAGEWKSFVELLKKYRARQPINGVIITISVADLLSESSESLAIQAGALRKRLLELHLQLGISFPVYVMITKTDLLNGFMAYFSKFDKTQRDQIWGFTFPYEQARQADFDLKRAVESQYTLLQQRLDAALPETLLLEHDAQQRAECYLFPQEFAALRPFLNQYLDIVFTRSNFETCFTPRGIYFTSGTQEGLPFDRVMGELNRYLKLPPNQSADQDNTHWSGLNQEAPRPAAKGQSFFLKDMLEKVVFQESGLAGSNRWWEYRNRALHWAGYISLGVILVILGGVWFTSYDNNKAYLADVTAKVPLLESQGQGLAQQATGDMLTLLPFLNSVLNLPESQHFSLQNAPFSYRMGLYRGAQISNASNALYQKALKELLLPQVAQQITNTLRHDNRSDADFSYEALKAYQMLYLPKHYNGEFLRAWVMLNLQRNLRQGITQQQLQQLEWHLSQLLDGQIQSSPYAKDEALVAQAQSALGRSPLPQRVYSRLKRLLLKQSEIKPVSLVDLAGAQAELAFSRQSGKPVTDGIPGLFTPQGYWKAFDNNIGQVTETLRQEDVWVLNTQTASEQKSTDLTKIVRQLYMQDFIAVWDELLADIRLANISELSQRINSARLLSGNPSPMRNLLVNIRKYVTLRDENSDADQRSVLGKAGDKLNQGANHTLEALFTTRPANADGDLSTQPELVVMAHFAPLLELAQSQGEGSKAIPFDAVLKQVDDLYSYLTAVQGATNSGMAIPPSDIIPRLQAESGRLPTPFKQMLLSLAIGASSDAQREDMENVKKRINVEVGSFCRQAIAGRYPLNPRSAQDVTPDDLARMFAPNTGLMDNFFRDNLQGKVDSTRPTWRFTPGVDGKTLPGGEGILSSFQQAQRIRDAFFANGTAVPSYRVTVRPLRMDNDILNLTLDIDGQLFKYSHGPQVPLVVSWPGIRNTNQVHLQLSLANGTTASMVTSGPWALNRMVDRAASSAGSNLSRQATFNLDGHSVTLEFTPNSIRNPFQLPAFSCP
ncbi:MULTISPECIES: type VI secretion system membrane subunit TssM [unclassified Serratia (in: enterobacteria)]|uniref:type VI secretion system membrane subunit TssM n=1 Tax=unclassified Serratia (in: enterobacteria) TaxID=2647522 RepID=UPI000501F953|nr:MULTISPECIES: type VI secretion system membrane subunit TssM [unclassified Serratia (in: enterobacteria)]KFK97911.1 type VI secretion system protein ImpL [Serratia sp. Ag2]KFL00302.1 type VI secretion system protein ImpL [Serratia sp. Ag1]